ncbi:MAG: hypothetical protein NDI94_01730, partial [Candidatus Woesearchaeota archaeon]|nr:hypothetical protein [Candidatus Woesearchaeota archaeon]
KIDSGEEVRILARLKNKNAYSSIKNVSLKIISDFANFSDPYHLLIKGNETVILLNSIMQVPQLETEKSYKLKFNLTYLSEDNARFSEKFEKTLTVKPSGITLSVEGNGEAYENTPVKYTVTIKNLAGVNLNVDFKSILPVQAIGATSFYSTVNKSKSKTFEITVLPGYVEKDTEYIMNFSADYELLGERKSEASKKLKVKPKKPSVTISRSLSKSTMYKGDLADVTYTLSNADTFPVYNLRLIGIKSNRADSLTFFEFSLDKLDAGEKTTFSGGQILAKKSGSIGKSILFFEDDKKRRFNATSEDNSIDVKDSNNEVYELEITQHNDTHIASSLRSNGIISTEYKPFTTQDFKEYELYGKQARAYSNVLIWKQISNTTVQEPIVQEEAAQPDGNKSDEPIEEKNEPPEKKSKTSVWKAMANWFMGLFKKR